MTQRDSTELNFDFTPNHPDIKLLAVLNFFWCLSKQKQFDIPGYLAAQKKTEQPKTLILHGQLA